MYLIDTNIFLEMLLEQEKAEECESLLDKVESGKENFYVSSFTLHSIEINLTRNNKPTELGEFLSDLLWSRIIRIDTTTENELAVLEIMKKEKLDFDDAIQLYLCKKNNLKIISFDQHFDKTDIERIEPKDV